MLKLIVTHSVLSIISEKRYSPDLTVKQLKAKLEMVVGTSPENMILQHRDQDDKVLCTLQPDDLKIGKFDLKHYSNIHVVDIKPDGGVVSQLNAMNQGKTVNVPKYEISEEAYKKRGDTFAKWKDKNLKEFYQNKENDEKAQAQKWDECAKEISIGNRCQVGTNDMKHRGVVKYVGPCKLDKNGIFIGIQLDEPYGKYNGTVKDKQYFKCQDNYGLFVRPDEVEVGDFPEIDELDLELSDDDNEEL